ncbi:hypothetical protein [Nocardioides sp. L-11A]|uniref:hypothetical protein n=1 Tax=Nocardioides sp. L-11A TaxID=3043848 RepID=UPI00249AC930|nr:hypothetical protein QJ852_10030 [Nocardioides sp. L-11A]
MTETSTTSNTTDQRAPYGTALDHQYRRHVDVIGEVEQSIAGNALLRVGSFDRAEGHWHQTAHVVLTPDERERLIAALVAQREAAGDPGCACGMSAGPRCPDAAGRPLCTFEGTR